MDPRFVPCEIRRGGRSVRTETAVYESGLRVLTIATTAAALGMQLVSTYTADDVLDEALVSEAIEWPDSGVPELSSRRIEVPLRFATHRRDIALDDHLRRFCELASRAHGEAFELARSGRIDAAAAYSG